MGRFMILSLLLCFFAPYLSAQYVRENYDLKTLAQVQTNIASQKTVEYLHTQTVDTIRKKQNKLLALAGSLATYKTVFNMTLENASGFGVESGIYKSIVSTCEDIVIHSGLATEALWKTNFTGKAIGVIRIAEMVTEAAHLGNTFFAIVTNGTVKNPLKGKMDGAADVKKDEINLLNRYERLRMALSINMQLKDINTKLILLTYLSQHNSLNSLLLAIDRKTWITYHYSKNSTNNIINGWNKLCGK